MLVDVLVASAIMFTGALALLNMMPMLTRMAVKMTMSNELSYFLYSKQEAMLAGTYNDINTTATQTGDFTSLLGTEVAANADVTWLYSASEKVTGRLKEVKLSVAYSPDVDTSAFITTQSDTWTFYVADLDNENLQTP